MLGLSPIYALACLEWQSTLFRKICDRSVAIALNKLRGLNDMGLELKTVIYGIICGVIALSINHLLSSDFHNQYRTQQIERTK